MPTFSRTERRLDERDRSCPTTVAVPCWKGSSPFMHRISVDFPEPDGPQSTTFSPGSE